MERDENFIDNRTLLLNFDLIYAGDCEGLENVFRNSGTKFTTSYLSMCYPNGETPLIFAASFGHAKIVQLFVCF